MKKNNKRSATKKEMPGAKRIVRIAQSKLKQVLPMIPDCEEHSDLRDRMARAIARNDISASNVLRAVLPELQELIAEAVPVARKQIDGSV